MRSRKGLEDRFRLAGMLIIAGLAVIFLTLFWTHSLSFTLFASVGAVPVAAGIVIYLYSLVKWHE